MKNKIENDEYLDLVDEKDNVIGKKLRSEIYKEGLNNYRVVNAFIVNSQGKIWIPKRTADKKIFPLCLDMSLAEHVSSGETYEDAFKRGLDEELNLELEKLDYKFLGHLSPYKDDISCFMNIYEIKKDETPDYNKNDFIKYFWLMPEEILNLIKKGEKAKDHLLKLIEHFYT